MTTALNHAHMEKSVAGAVTKRDEAKAFARVIPLDGGSNGGPGWAVELRITRWRRSKITRRWLVVIVGKITAAGRAKISVSIGHVRCSEQGALAFGKVAPEAKSFLLVPKDELAQQFLVCIACRAKRGKLDLVIVEPNPDLVHQVGKRNGNAHSHWNGGCGCHVRGFRR